VTVTYVEVSADLRNAKIHVSVMGDEKKQLLCLRGLQHAAGFLQAKVSDRVATRFTPKLQFKLDRGVKNSLEVARILQEVLPPQPSDAEPDSAGTDAPPADEPTN
jgi:ribosome-binding factor A